MEIDDWLYAAVLICLALPPLPQTILYLGDLHADHDVQLEPRQGHPSLGLTRFEPNLFPVDGITIHIYNICP
jgi:hypothetical protein